ncbi:MAG: DivIVA domain-containing protein [Erysipelotrichaceae bacterium]|nr:DivIVA domain-containing protein [Erysipelotrichaceae bacterium]
MSLRSRAAARQAEYQKMQEEAETNDILEENQMLKEQLLRYQQQIKTANEQLVLIKQRYQVLINELTLREKAADEISRLALKEANTIIETAQGNADMIIQEALTNARMVFVEIEQLTNKTEGMRTEIKGKLQNMDNMLESFTMPEVPDLDLLIGKTKSEEQDALAE